MVFRKAMLALILVFLLAAASLSPARIVMKPEGYFETPGFAFLVYHNDYLMGRRGGLEAFLHGKRIIDAGEIVCLTSQGQSIDYDRRQTGKRVVDAGRGSSSVPEKIESLGMSYRLVCGTDGASVLIKVALDRPVDWGRVSKFGLKLEVYPKEYASKTYSAGGESGLFVERYMGKATLVPEAREIRFAAEDPLRAFTVSSADAWLSLTDGRGASENNGFIILASLPVGSAEREFSLKLAPRVDPDWRREPVIQVSQVGYHPDQRKVAVLELDSRTASPGTVTLTRLDSDGSRKTVKTAVPVRWGHLFDFEYYTFDFSEVKTPGHYYVQYAGREAGPLSIRPDVYLETWHPTLDVFFPAQMCHVEVRQGERVWHGACHLDDARQAPPNTVYIDSYRQKAETETRFKANEHIPGLDWGGWHDAGDSDLPTGSICQTVNGLALAREEFGARRDVTAIGRDERLVSLFQPDGRDDLLQQVAFGTEWLIQVYRAAGHVCAGVIESKESDYAVTGDPVNITDGRIYDPSLKAHEKKDGRSGKPDDRWLFTNRNTAGQYQLAQTAAIAARVLTGFDQKLADECLKTARELWDYEQTHPRIDFEVTYQPQEDEFHSWELNAAAELFLTTGEAKYRRRLLELAPFIGKMPAATFGGVAGFTLARVAAKVEDQGFEAVVAKKAAEVAALLVKQFATNPYGVVFDFEVWGNNWDVLDVGVKTYYFIKHFPGLFKKDYLYDALNYNFGCHPATNHSYVSGVGVRSATVGYGFNRPDVTYIPGGVVSGASFLRPKFIEYRADEWDWYETEYVIGGAAAYIFDALAVDFLLNGK